MTFIRDRGRGKRGELKIVELLRSAGIFAENVNNKEKYDLACHLNGHAFFIEVKCDFKACVTHNVAFEIRNTKKDEPSGVFSTKADLWCHIIGKKIYIIRVVSLLDIIKKGGYWKIVEGGDKNSRIILYRSDVLDNFVRIDNLDKSDIKEKIECLLK